MFVNRVGVVVVGPVRVMDAGVSRRRKRFGSWGGIGTDG